MEVFIKLLPYLVSLTSGVVLCVCTYKINRMLARRDKQLEEEQIRNEAIAEGICCLLRDSIVEVFNDYNARGYCPIHVKERVKKEYAAYHKLGGNDVVTELYHKLLAMPEDDRYER